MKISQKKNTCRKSQKLRPSLDWYVSDTPRIIINPFLIFRTQCSRNIDLLSLRLSQKLIIDQMAETPNKTTIDVEPTIDFADDEDFPLMDGEKKETPSEEFIRQRNLAEEACQLGRKLLKQSQYIEASKQFSKAVMTFEYILKNNPKMSDFKTDIANMIKDIIQPAYSNLSLCYFKLQKWHLVINFANQVLQTDKDNIKNLYRRGVARKMSKMYDQAIEDLEKVKAMDEGMKVTCAQLIQECRELKKESRKKQKQIAKSLITGYSSQKPEPKPVIQNPVTTIPPQKWWQRGLKCIRDSCSRIFTRK